MLLPREQPDPRWPVVFAKLNKNKLGPGLGQANIAACVIFLCHYFYLCLDRPLDQIEARVRTTLDPYGFLSKTLKEAKSNELAYAADYVIVPSYSGRVYFAQQ
ncbi:hypothetical protein [Marinobacter sp. 3-2]|jgi:hypothetical protein|uniref:hypothetical protein n=1 Tax=Marinobacter sp. 3-2 TaxID=2485141 RepID=UPI000DD295E6|nr:hypothetical protein [Marinobacter sp. 3-2]